MALLKYVLPFFIFSSTLFADKTTDNIQNYIFEKLPEYGTLKQDALGFVYVDISDDYIHKLCEFIQEEGYEEPPYFGHGLHGAHISVVYAKEADSFGVNDIEEIGNTVYFKIKSCKVITPEDKEGIESIYLITVDSPVLHKIRKKHDLPKMKYDFHITIGIKYSDVDAA